MCLYSRYSLPYKGAVFSKPKPLFLCWAEWPMIFDVFYKQNDSTFLWFHLKYNFNVTLYLRQVQIIFYLSDRQETLMNVKKYSIVMIRVYYSFLQHTQSQYNELLLSSSHERFSNHSLLLCGPRTIYILSIFPFTLI